MPSGKEPTGAEARIELREQRRDLVRRLAEAAGMRVIEIEDGEVE